MTDRVIAEVASSSYVLMSARDATALAELLLRAERVEYDWSDKVWRYAKTSRDDGVRLVRCTPAMLATMALEG